MSETRTPEISQQDGVTVVALGPAYESLDDRILLDELAEILLHVADTADPPRMALDLSGTKFFGSSFIEVLFRVWNRLNARGGGGFCISGMHPYCAEVIALTHLDRLWKVAGTRDEAVRLLSGEGEPPVSRSQPSQP